MTETNQLIVADIAVKMTNEFNVSAIPSIEKISNALKDSHTVLRERMIQDNMIQTFSEVKCDEYTLYACDCAYAQESYLPLSVCSFLSVIGSQKKGFLTDQEVMVIPSTEQAHLFVVFQRYLRELSMLINVESNQISILDGSFWTSLLQINVAIDQMMRLKGQYPRDLKGVCLSEYCKAITRPKDSDKSLIRQMLENPNIIGMSKRAESTHFARQYKDLYQQEDNTYFLLPDKALMSFVLNEGEYTRPFSFNKDNAGVHTDKEIGFSTQDRRWLKDHYTKNLSVLYFRPHRYHSAFRIEFNNKKFKGDELNKLLSLVKQETVINIVKEPMPQYMTDFVTKQVSDSSRLFDQIITANYPYITNYRSK